MNWQEHHIRLPDTMCHSREERGLTPFYVNIVLIVSIFLSGAAIAETPEPGKEIFYVDVTSIK